MLKLLFKAFLFLVIIQTTLFAQDINIDNIVKKATLSGKHLFVWLHKTDCVYCKNMKKTTLNDGSVKSLIENNFIFIHVNISDDCSVKYKNFHGSGRAFAKMMGYDFYPTSLFFNSDNEMIYAISGYQNKKTFSMVLKYIASKTYKKKDFETFASELEFEEEI